MTPFFLKFDLHSLSAVFGAIRYIRAEKTSPENEIGSVIPPENRHFRAARLASLLILLIVLPRINTTSSLCR